MNTQVNDARRALVQQILSATPPRLSAVGYETGAPSWARSADHFASKLAHALLVPPDPDITAACAWYRSAIADARARAAAAKLRRDRVMLAMLGGDPSTLQHRPGLHSEPRDAAAAAGAGCIVDFLDPAQLEAVGLWRIWMSERDSLNAIRDQALALERDGERAWRGALGRPFPAPDARGAVIRAIQRRWS